MDSGEEARKKELEDDRRRRRLNLSIVGAWAGPLVMSILPRTPVVVSSVIALLAICLFYGVCQLPWVAECYRPFKWVRILTGWAIVSVALAVFGVIVWPPRTDSIVLNFKSSTLMTPAIKANITEQFNEAYTFLKSVGIDGPTNLPMIGVAPPGSGLKDEERPNQPEYHSDLLIDASKLGDDFWIRRVYIVFTLKLMLHLDDPAALIAEPPAGDSFIRWIVHYMAADYLTSSSFGRLTDEKLSLHEWLQGIWNVREKCGQELADFSVAYMLKDWSRPGLLPQGQFDINSYLYRRFSEAVSVKDSGDHYQCWNSALKEYVPLKGEP